MAPTDTETAFLETLRALRAKETPPAAKALPAARMPQAQKAAPVEDPPKLPRRKTGTLDVPEGFWDAAKVEPPQTKKAVSLRVDPDILAFFKSQGPGHLTRMHAVLRSYVDAQKKR